MPGSNYLNSGTGIYAENPCSMGVGFHGVLSAYRSLSAAVRIFGRGKSRFTTDDVLAAYPQHNRRALQKALSKMCDSGLAKRIEPGVYRLQGEV